MVAPTSLEGHFQEARQLWKSNSRKVCSFFIIHEVGDGRDRCSILLEDFLKLINGLQSMSLGTDLKTFGTDQFYLCGVTLHDHRILV